MQKYIENRIKKIDLLMEELCSINHRIDDHIYTLEQFKQSFDLNNSIEFVLSTDKSTYNNSLYLKKLCIKITIKNQSINLYFKEDYTQFLEKNLPLDVLVVLSTIIYNINQQIKIESMQNDVKISHDLFNKINKIYKEIEEKKSTYIENSNFILKNINKFVSENNLLLLQSELDKKFFTLKQYKKTKTIHLMDADIDNYDFIILIPDQEILFKKHNIDITIDNDRNVMIDNDRNVMINIYKEEFIKLNSFIINFLFNDKSDIYFNCFISIHMDYRFKKCSFRLEDFNEQKIEIISQRMKLNDELSNF